MESWIFAVKRWERRLYAVFYRETRGWNRMFTPDYLDPVFIRLDEKLFGAQPSLTFMQRLPYWPVSARSIAATITSWMSWRES